MRTVLRSLFISSLMIGSSCHLHAAVMDITMVPGQNNDLEVRVRTDQNFNEVFSSLVFAVRWSNSSGANLGSVQQDGLQQDVTNLNSSGPEQVDGNYRYQVYAGFGFSVLNDVGFAFSGGQEFVLCHIPVLNAVDVFSIVNDTWTAGNNADYYVSLNGSNSTGVIYDTSTGVEQGPALAGQLSVWPNPAGERITVTLETKDGEGPVQLELIGSNGQLVMSTRLQMVVGKGSQVIDLRAIDPAVYLLRASTAKGARTVPLIKR
jgi:hypothetical protein